MIWDKQLVEDVQTNDTERINKLVLVLSWCYLLISLFFWSTNLGVIVIYGIDEMPYLIDAIPLNLILAECLNIVLNPLVCVLIFSKRVLDRYVGEITLASALILILADAAVLPKYSLYYLFLVPHVLLFVYLYKLRKVVKHARSL